MTRLDFGGQRSRSQQAVEVAKAATSTFQVLTDVHISFIIVLAVVNLFVIKSALRIPRHLLVEHVANL